MSDSHHKPTITFSNHHGTITNEQNDTLEVKEFDV